MTDSQVCQSEAFGGHMEMISQEMQSHVQCLEHI